MLRENRGGPVVYLIAAMLRAFGAVQVIRHITNRLEVTRATVGQRSTTIGVNVAADAFARSRWSHFLLTPLSR
jgi:hypothetical protein